MFSPSLWPLVLFPMVCRILLHIFQTPSQLLALILELDLGEQPLLILHSCLVALRSLKRLLLWEAFLILTPGLILLLLGGATNLVDKILIKFCPIPSPPQCLIPNQHVWHDESTSILTDSHPKEVSFTPWETPNLDPLWLGEIFITPIRTFLLE
jgi:hypothetical protein